MPKINSADLQVNKPINASAPDLTLTIEVDPAKQLRVGEYTFHLVVTDDAGNVSAPFPFTMTIADQGKPVAKITGDKLVASGKTFTLSGKDSFGPEGGQIKLYRWMLVSAPGAGSGPTGDSPS